MHESMKCMRCSCCSIPCPWLLGSRHTSACNIIADKGFPAMSLDLRCLTLSTPCLWRAPCPSCQLQGSGRLKTRTSAVRLLCRNPVRRLSAKDRARFLSALCTYLLDGAQRRCPARLRLCICVATRARRPLVSWGAKAEFGPRATAQGRSYRRSLHCSPDGHCQGLHPAAHRRQASQWLGKRGPGTPGKGWHGSV